MSARTAPVTCLIAAALLLGATAEPSIAATSTLLDSNPFEFGASSVSAWKRQHRRASVRQRNEEAKSLDEHGCRPARP